MNPPPKVVQGEKHKRNFMNPILEQVAPNDAILGGSDLLELEQARCIATHAPCTVLVLHECGIGPRQGRMVFSKS